jgi:glycosyltransferase involved in cell wall biosynthesis
MRIDLIFPAYPPFPHAVGEYTALLAAALRQEGVAARVICASEQSVAGAVLKTAVSEEFVDGVHVIKGFSLHRPEEIVATIQSDPPAVAVLQYCPFSWGVRGWSPGLVRAWRQLAKKCPSVGRITMFHELWTETASWKARLMKVYQKAQAIAVARESHSLCFSSHGWYRRMKQSVKDLPARVIPVGTNIPVVPITALEARRRLGISESAPVLGVMGTGHRSRRFDLVAAAFRATVAIQPNARLLYIGPDRRVLAEAFGGEQNLRELAVIADGWADEMETSKRLAAVDLYLCPFSDGVSCRRGSFIAGLAHGLVCLSTRGNDTDPVLLEATDHGCAALHLVDAQDRDGFARRAVALVKSRSTASPGRNAARDLYQRVFAWDSIAKAFIEVAEQLPSGRNNFQETRFGPQTT